MKISFKKGVLLYAGILSFWQLLNFWNDNSIYINILLNNFQSTNGQIISSTRVDSREGVSYDVSFKFTISHKEIVLYGISHCGIESDFNPNKTVKIIYSIGNTSKAKVVSILDLVVNYIMIGIMVLFTINMFYIIVMLFKLPLA